MLLSSGLAGMCLAIQGQKIQISGVSYVADDIVVCEFQEPVSLNGRIEQYLALTPDSHLHSVDVFASPAGFLTVDHGVALLAA